MKDKIADAVEAQYRPMAMKVPLELLNAPDDFREINQFDVVVSTDPSRQEPAELGLVLDLSEGKPLVGFFGDPDAVLVDEDYLTVVTSTNLDAIIRDAHA